MNGVKFHLCLLIATSLCCYFGADADLKAGLYLKTGVKGGAHKAIRIEVHLKGGANLETGVKSGASKDRGPAAKLNTGEIDSGIISETPETNTNEEKEGKTENVQANEKELNPTEEKNDAKTDKRTEQDESVRKDESEKHDEGANTGESKNPATDLEIDSGIISETPETNTNEQKEGETENVQANEKELKPTEEKSDAKTDKRTEQDESVRKDESEKQDEGANTGESKNPATDLEIDSGIISETPETNTNEQKEGETENVQANEKELKPTEEKSDAKTDKRTEQDESVRKDESEKQDEGANTAESKNPATDLENLSGMGSTKLKHREKLKHRRKGKSPLHPCCIFKRRCCASRGR